MMKDMYIIEFYDDYENSNNAKNLGPMDEFSVLGVHQRWHHFASVWGAPLRAGSPRGNWCPAGCC